MKALALLSALVFAACNAGVGGPSPTPVPVEKVTFIAGFKPQADLPFVAVYMAQEKGYFRDQSLEVEIQHATGGEHIQLIPHTSITDFPPTDTASTSGLRRSPLQLPQRRVDRNL